MAIREKRFLCGKYLEVEIPAFEVTDEAVDKAIDEKSKEIMTV